MLLLDWLLKTHHQRAAMTSFLIKAHVGRKMPLEWEENDSCAFCRIIERQSFASIVYETDKVIAILGEFDAGCL